ncbi:MAG: hypothetical protein CL807_00755 [Citromicrobium sp.]|nr:hypothetical protein [Citromicrobium sp.]MBD75433.1 hypothetical protein [Citromicrobium sp.]MBT46127.1 hypothetical protein [Citromicrobium sp.]|tara:strand:+ start:13466 stop:13840 length:375 start_codon:yes stop_codon:yes gene_type:complete
MSLAFCSRKLIQLAATASALCLSGCNSSGDDPNSAYNRALLEQGAQEKVKSILRDPVSAEFSGMIVRPLPEPGVGIVCGYVNSRNGFGGMSGPKRFVITPDLFQIEGQTPLADLLRTWGMVCNP